MNRTNYARNLRLLALCAMLMPLLVAVGAAPAATAKPLSVANITIQHYPQGRGVDCAWDDDWEYQQITQYEYIQSDVPGSVRYGTAALYSDCTSDLTVTYSGPPPTITYRSKVNFRLAVTEVFTAAHLSTIYLDQEPAGDCYNVGYPPSGYGDNVVNIDDFNLLYNAFGWAYPDEDYEVRCDFDSDGAVTIADFNMLYTHFGYEGAPSMR